MPKVGHVTDLREQWLVRADGALAHRLQDREISSHLCENRYRNQQIREDFPVALSEQRDIEHEMRSRELARRRQAEIDAEIAREMAEINIRKQKRLKQTSEMVQPSSSRALPVQPSPFAPDINPSPFTPDINPDELGLSASELEEMRKRLEQEEHDAKLARQLSHEVDGQEALLADMRVAVEAQDGELARLLQEREYKKLQRAKEKARQKALLKKQKLAQEAPPEPPQATLCDAYSNPRDIIRQNGLRLCKSVDSDLNYVEPFEKECIQSKESALKSYEQSKQLYAREAGTSSSNLNSYSCPPESQASSNTPLHHRHPPPPPSTSKKPRFPDPVSIRPASHYPTDNVISSATNISLTHSVSENNNLYSCTFADNIISPQTSYDKADRSKRLSVISDITAEGLAKKKSKQADLQKKRRGCKIQ
ncbi:unnamed protein product [Leptosia nina]|uniref:Coiled-coil domain-containing protein n=1 Tax=Leptosia nina TaxID=320188 RepID=A0AAV1JQ97_9NEOP